jgi:hypothetical protein
VEIDLQVDLAAEKQKGEISVDRLVKKEVVFFFFGYSSWRKQQKWQWRDYLSQWRCIECYAERK